MKNQGRGAATNIGYRVEVRTTFFSTTHPTALHDGIVGPEWRVVNFERGNNHAGIPENPFNNLAQHDLLTSEAATALAWTLIAQNPHQCLQCRIVEYRLQSSYSIDRTGIAGEVIQRHEISHPLNTQPYPGDDDEEKSE